MYVAFLLCFPEVFLHSIWATNNDNINDNKRPSSHHVILTVRSYVYVRKVHDYDVLSLVIKYNRLFHPNPVTGLLSVPGTDEHQTRISDYGNACQKNN